jgi:hypothetical protein
MRRPVFLCIMNAVDEYDDYFVQKRNAAGVLGLSCLQKIVAAFRTLPYGAPVMLRMSIFVLVRVPL